MQFNRDTLPLPCNYQSFGGSTYLISPLQNSKLVKTKYHSATMAHHSRSHAITDFIFLRPIREKWLFGHVVAAESRRQPPPVMVQAGGVLGRRAAAAGWRRSEVFAIAAAGALLLVATVVLKAPGRAEVGACCALPPQRQLVSCVG